MSSLNPSSFIVLGLLAKLGDMTSYDLKQCADTSVGYFWPFSRAQLYKEPARLAEQGLLAEHQEDDGRRRRLYRITKKGKQALRAWLAEPVSDPTEIRDQALLKLFFAEQGTAGDLCQLIATQIAEHGKRLKDYEQIQGSVVAAVPEWRFHEAALRMGIMFERMAIRFWQDLAKDPPEIED